MTPIRVIKIGGSLLQRSNLLADLRAWHQTLTEPMINVWIVGGGPAVEAIRNYDQFRSLSDDDAHWASIEAMDCNALSFASHVPNWQLTADHNDPRKVAESLINGQSPATDLSPCNFILQTKDWLVANDREPNSLQLPHSWDVTSDSICAWAAIQLHASELILLKSCEVPDATVAALAGLGIIDTYMPILDLRRPSFRFSCLQLPRSIN